MTRVRHRKDRPIIEVRESRIQGSGVFATKVIRRGTRIIEYVGERISPDEELRRYQEDTMKRHHTFLFEVDEETTIDGAVDGNEARFINHSCDPNCEAVNEDGRIFIEAISSIKPGEELLYDYSFQVEEEVDEEERAFYVCHCGASNCRGTILIEGDEAKKRSAGKGRRP
jgi:SET domain-containing protein